MSPITNVIEVTVDCPSCGNANRAARRRCSECGRTGKVTKNVPVEKAPWVGYATAEFEDKS